MWELVIFVAAVTLYAITHDSQITGDGSKPVYASLVLGGVMSLCVAMGRVWAGHLALLSNLSWHHVRLFALAASLVFQLANFKYQASTKDVLRPIDRFLLIVFTQALAGIFFGICSTVIQFPTMWLAIGVGVVTTILTWVKVRLSQSPL